MIVMAYAQTEWGILLGKTFQVDAKRMHTSSDSREHNAVTEAAFTDENEYRRNFIDVSNRIEKLLRGLIWTGLAALVAVQLLLTVPSVRLWAVKVERLEGVPFEREQDVFRP